MWQTSEILNTAPHTSSARVLLKLIVCLFMAPETESCLESPVAEFAHVLSLEGDCGERRGVVEERVRLLRHEQLLSSTGAFRQACGAVGLQRLDFGEWRGWG